MIKVTRRDVTSFRTLIQTQLAALAEHDADRAFSVASPTIQRRFGTPDAFMDTVLSSYLPVYAPRRVEFVDVVLVEKSPAQRVRLTAHDGSVVIALYLMEQQRDQSWRISGCILTRDGERPPTMKQ